MIDSLTNTLQVVSPHLNTNLVSSKSLDRFNQITDLLPNIPNVSEVIFESHLGSSRPKTDFQASFNRLNGARKASVDCCKSLINITHANPIWSRVHNFCVRWSDVESPLYDSVDNIWLEFDVDDNVDAQPSDFPEPSFFFTFTPTGLQSLKTKKNKNTKFLTNNISHTKNWVSDEALRLLLGGLLPDKVQKNLLTCFDLLPSDAEIRHIGVMLPRISESKAIRLVLQGTSCEQILKYLRNIGWAGSVEQLSSILSKLSSLVDCIRIQFSVEDTIHPKIGIECYFNVNKHPRNSPRWQSFLAFLVEKQLCTVEKVNALLDWPGYSEEKDNQELWSKKLNKASVFTSPNSRTTLVRLLSYIKIVYEPNQPLQAKAYMSLSHRWLDFNGCFKQ
jgi:hypothetical protein